MNNFIKSVNQDGGIIHIAGLMSDGRVHANIVDILKTTKYILDCGMRVCIHFIGDGRDTPPQSAQKYIDLIKSELALWFENGSVFFGTLSGRYYTMDRNNNMDRTELAYDAIANGEAEYHAQNIDCALADAYARGETDEFIKPTVINATKLTTQDGFLFCNYRSDRARQIMRKVVENFVFLNMAKVWMNYALHFCQILKQRIHWVTSWQRTVNHNYELRKQKNITM